MKRLFLLGAAAAVALQITACTPSPKDVVEERIDTKVDQVEGTVDTAANEAKDAAESMVDTATDAIDGLADWGTDVVDALGTLGVQAASLKTDPTSMADSGWRSATEESIETLQGLADQAATAAGELEAEGKMPMLQSSLDAMAAELSALTAKSSEALMAEDADAFLSATEDLETVTTAVGAAQMIIDELK